MGNNAASNRITLGELVWGLAAGQPCPCCGQMLQSGAMHKERCERTHCEAPSDGDSIVVYCPGCWFEVIDGPGKNQARPHQAMASAA